MAIQTTSQKILIITYYWPPAGGSGVQRWLYFSKYLKKLGYTPYVLTVDSKRASYPKTDKSLEKKAKGITVFKTKTREWLRWYSFLKGGDFKNNVPQGSVPKNGFFSKFAAFVRGNFWIPDARKGWIPFASRKAAQLIAEENIPYLITTGPPHSTHLIGLRLKKTFSFKWIADFRDPWTDIFYAKDFYRTPMAQKKDSALEQRVLNKADAILTTVTDELHEQLRAKTAHSQRFFSIYNGYDDALMNAVSSKKPAVFQIAFTGLLTVNQPYQSIIKVLEKAIQNFPKVPIRFSLAGSIDPRIFNEIQKELATIEVINHGYLPHADAVQLMKSSHLLLNFIFGGAHNRQMISGKLLEYMASGTPILSLGSADSDAGRILSNSDCAVMLSETEGIKMQAFVETLLNAWQKGRPLQNKWKDKEKYSRLELTRELVRILKEI